MANRDWMKLFLEFHARNPHFYTVFEKQTMKLVDVGHRVLGNRLIFCQLRFIEMQTWVPVKKDGTENVEGAPIRLNDAYASFYARMFMHRRPEHPVFKKRKTFIFEKAFSIWLDRTAGGTVPLQEAA